MKAAFFGLLGAFALLGASCSVSVKDFAPVVLDSASYANSYTSALQGAISEDDYTRYYGKYSFRYGPLSDNIWYPFNEFRNWNRTDTRDAFQPYVYVNGNVVYANAYYTAPQESASFSFTTPTGSVSSFEFKSSGQTRDILLYMTLDNALGLKPNTTYTFVYDVVGTTASAVGGLWLRNIALYEGSYKPYQPYGYGFSFDTPVTGSGSCVMDMYWNDGVFIPRNSYLAYNYADECILYTDGYKFDFGGDSDLQQTFLVEWLGAFASGTNRGFDWDNDYDDDYLVMIPLIDDYAEGAFCEFWIHDRYQAGFEDAQNTLYGGIFNNARYVTLTYRKDGGAFASVDYNGFNEAFTAFRPYMYNGLLAVNEWLYNDRGGSLLPGWDGSSDVGLIIDYSENVSITASPLYIDVEVFTDVPAAGSCSTFTPRLPNASTPMTLTFDRSFKGLATDYYSYDSRYDVFKGYAFTFPAQPPVCQTNYVGILSNYAAGYLDGVNSRNAEISDLSQRIIDLQSDLSQYRGYSYEEIYNMGKAAGLQSGNNANQVLSGLFGAILSVPMSIFGGLGDMTIVGVSVMSLIASLLLVAVAVVVIKKLL